jgi:pimeloyl-ACP methyl ester carboxylesterase
MRILRKTYVDTPAGQIHCHVVEGLKPAMLFLHQTAASAASYDPLLRALDLPNQLIAIDTPGFGGSFDPQGWPSLSDYAEQIVAAVDALAIDRFHLFGHHTGATLGIEIAARYPGRALSLMMAGPVFMTDQERADFAAGYSVPFTPQRDGSHLLTNWNYAASYNPDCDVELLHGEVVAMLRAWRGRPQAYSAVAHHDSARAMRTLRLPVLLLTSPNDFFHASFDRAQALAPEATVAVTGGGNFQPGADAPGVARAIEAFLAGIGADRGTAP